MKKITATVILAVYLITASPLSARDFNDEGEASLDYFLKLIQENTPVSVPIEGIEPLNDILYCTGSSAAARANNKAAALMTQGKFEEAKNELLAVISHSALFFPFQYNLGLCYYHLNDRERAHVHLNKAKNIVPEYYLTYIQTGNLESFEGNDDAAILEYRNALRRNPKHLNSLVLVGDIYFNRRQVKAASRYYEAVL
ncbi:MAG: tetratricopeptide repeat protein, partial [Spirochaetota bacterium]